jgi:hypothetical protein
MKEKVLTCVICQGDIEHQKNPEGKVYWTEGHNAEPVAQGRCCGDCNDLVVIPTRLRQSFGVGK